MNKSLGNQKQASDQQLAQLASAAEESAKNIFEDDSGIKLS